MDEEETEESAVAFLHRLALQYPNVVLHRWRVWFRNGAAGSSRPKSDRLAGKCAKRATA